MTIRDRRFQEPTPESMGEAGAFAFRLLVSPVAGRLRHLPPTTFRSGEEWVSAGQTVVVVERGSDVVGINSPVDGRLSRMLARDGEPVSPGQPLAWLEQDPGESKVRPIRGPIR
jgi:biotin carboxyl carrier protein